MTTQAKPAELRECPFCGEDVYIDGHLESDNYSYWITIRCCEVEMRFSLMWHEFSKRRKRDGEPRTLKWMERQLARLWNSRPSDDLRAENERLRRELLRQKQGWENILELDLLPSRHRPTAQMVLNSARVALQDKTDG